MIFQLTDLCAKTVKGYTTVQGLKTAVMQLTEDLSEAESVYEWATTPLIGGFRYDGPTFSVTIIDQEVNL